MYRINVLTAGKHNNVTLGARYCLFKKTALDLATFFASLDCNVTIAKFVRLHDDVFSWSEGEVCEDRYFDSFYEMLEET